MPTYRMDIEYDGTNYVGWQYQTNGRSIQGEIEKALRILLKKDIRIVGGGRTDTGVHARAQVASFRFDHIENLQQLKYNINGILPNDIVLHKLEIAPDNFHARHSAKSRYYSYHISQKRVAIQRLYCWQIYTKLDLSVMQQCAASVLGTHDFRSFAKLLKDNNDFKCNVMLSEWIENSNMLEYHIKANRFLYSMVRTLVANMVQCGKGKMSYDQFLEIFQARSRALAAAAAPAKGLFLESIEY